MEKPTKSPKKSPKRVSRSISFLVSHLDHVKKQAKKLRRSPNWYVNELIRNDSGNPEEC